METNLLRKLIEPKVGKFLRSARTMAGLSLEAAAQKLGYSEAERLDQHERGSSVECCEFIRITERYGIPKWFVAEFLADLQHEVWQLKKK